MDCEDVVKGLETVLGFMQALSSSGDGEKCDALRAAIALLTPPTTAEIEAARDTIAQWSPHSPTLATFRRALDDLARAPGLEAEVTVWRATSDMQAVAVATLESEQRDYERTVTRLNGRLARVRELLNSKVNGIAQGNVDAPVISCDELLAALAADAGLAGQGVWMVQLSCCGCENGVEYFPTWEAADAFRQEYERSGVSYSAHQRLGEAAHQRAGVVERADAGPTGEEPK